MRDCKEAGQGRWRAKHAASWADALLAAPRPSRACPPLPPVAACPAPAQARLHTPVAQRQLALHALVSHHGGGVTGREWLACWQPCHFALLPRAALSLKVVERKGQPRDGLQPERGGPLRR